MATASCYKIQKITSCKGAHVRVPHKMVMCCKFKYTILFIVTTSFVEVTIYGTVSEKMIHRYKSYKNDSRSNRYNFGKVITIDFLHSKTTEKGQ